MAVFEEVAGCVDPVTIMASAILGHFSESWVIFSGVEEAVVCRGLCRWCSNAYIHYVETHWRLTFENLEINSVTKRRSRYG